MAANYVLLEKITVGAAGASSVTFSGIPQTGYTDLVVKASARSDNTSVGVYVNYNGNSANYASLRLYADGATVYSDTHGSSAQIAVVAGENISTFTSNTFSNAEIYIPNYTSSNFKSASSDSVTENNSTTAWSALGANLWSNTAAITSIALTPAAGNFVQYSTFYLYGVAKLNTTPAIVPYATGGDTIMTDGTYWYHTFVSSGTFTPAKAITCDYLVVAGGGGAGKSYPGFYRAGSGGAGGMRCTVTGTGGSGSLESALSLASGTGYTVTIGAGGIAGNASGSGTNGSNSVFSSITSTGGGAGGDAGTPTTATVGNSGGSGGGGGSGATGAAGGSASPSGQGFAGGTGDNSSSGNGGGAASAGGTDPTVSTGRATSISGSSVTYSTGGNQLTSANATANTGNGGNIVSSQYAGAYAGGSGIVIVRYAV